jgi:SAM-dependent methyltransferase
MDRETIAAYDAKASGFAKEWNEQPAPADLHALIRRFFRRGRSADIGCGSGREVDWLCANGYPAAGYDASPGLVRAARARYPNLVFEIAALPDLAGIPDAAFDNVLCETVLMHLVREEISSAVRRLMSIVTPGGVLYLSWRVIEGNDQRDNHGRLYTAFDRILVIAELARGAILLDEEVMSASSGKKIHRVVVRKLDETSRA